MQRYVCIHGHFYQPPRENPWLEAVEVQDSAAPYHDWNERITTECYRPNAWSRVLDDQERIVRILNNYARISFNVGPTLLSWLERQAPEVYDAILAADRESASRYGGHGSAIAQAYHHTILPLAPRRDKELQVAWGVRDFTSRFGRPPEGIWLPETAVDLETLSVVADAGLKFTILSPFQAHRFRAKGTTEWTTVAPGTLPTTRAYEVRLPHDRTLSVFFYNGGVSADIAFRGLLHSGPAFADRLAGAFEEGLGDDAQLAHVATDGETYGHHHPHGDMALAFALDRLAARSDLRLTNYGEFLSRHPAAYEVEVDGPTAWSCAHGVGRWKTNCGCNSGIHPGWHQEWRAPLRAALEELRDTLRPALDDALESLLREPAAAVREYVDLFSDRSDARVNQFLTGHAARDLGEEETMRVLRLLELERQLQQMFTSCGWFFDDLSGIETVQILGYAGRAIQLAEEGLGVPVEERFLTALARARSNLAEVGDGRAVYQRLVRPHRIGLRNVSAHYALSSLFEEYPESVPIYCYTVRGSERWNFTAGTTRLTVGRTEVRSDITREAGQFTYGALYLGNHSLFGGVRPFQDEPAFQATAKGLVDAFERGDLPETIRLVDKEFGEGTYSLRLLFQDEQRKIVHRMLEATHDAVRASFRRIYETTAPILRDLAASESAAPAALKTAAEFYLNESMREALERDPPDIGEVAVRLRELARLHLAVDAASVGYAWSRAIERLMAALTANPHDLTTMEGLTALVELATAHAVDVDLTRVQNWYYELLRAPAEPTPRTPLAVAEAWERGFRSLGEQLRIRVE